MLKVLRVTACWSRPTSTWKSSSPTTPAPTARLPGPIVWRSAIQVRVNAVNVGFAGNLDPAARLATGDWLIMLSSDDLALPGRWPATAG